jgi:arabinogalactan oligomer/maltooligosaccharide transport system substrate-binding protein
MIKKFWSLLTVLILAAMVMSACATATTVAPVTTAAPTAITKTTVTFWHAYGTGSAEEVALAGVLAEAAVDLPQYDIQVLQVPFNDIFTKYSTDVAAGGGPDMFVAPNDNLGSEARGSLIADITDLALSKLGDYAPLSVDGMKTDGKLYGIPESLKAVTFWYDKTKITTPPATTDDLLKLMQNGTPIDISDSCYHVWGFYSSFGGSIFDANFNFVSDQGTGISDAMAFLNQVYQIEKKNSWPQTDSDGLAPFREGKISGISNGNWAMGDYRNALGDNLGVAPLPAGPGGVAKPLLGVDGYYINPNSTNKAGAVEVALYLTGAKAEALMMHAGHVPAITTATVTDPYLKALVEIFKNSIVRPQVAALDKYWANFCGMDQVFEKGVDPVTWVQQATAAAKK